MKQLIDNIEMVNNLIYNTLYKGRDFWGEKWSDTSIYKDGMTGARAEFQVMKSECEGYLNFAKHDFYWSNIRKDLEFREVESEGYVLRLQKYFEKYCGWIRKVDFDKAMKGLFIHDLLQDGYITADEAKQFCRLLAEISDKALSDACRAYEMLLSFTDSNDSEIKTPALNLLFQSAKKGEKKRFITFFSVPERDGVKIDSTNVVLLLKMIVGGDIKDRLKTNKIKLNSLWGELRQLKLIRADTPDNSLNKAYQNKTLPKPEIIELWNGAIQ